MAYDGKLLGRIWNAMAELSIPQKLMKLIKGCVENSVRKPYWRKKKFTDLNERLRK